MQHQRCQQCENQLHYDSSGCPGQSRLHPPPGFLKGLGRGKGAAWPCIARDQTLICTVRMLPSFSYLAGHIPSANIFALLCSDGNAQEHSPTSERCLGEKGVMWSPAHAEGQHIVTISPTIGLYNSMHFSPFILSLPFSCAIFPFIPFSALYYFTLRKPLIL